MRHPQRVSSRNHTLLRAGWALAQKGPRLLSALSLFRCQYTPPWERVGESLGSQHIHSGVSIMKVLSLRTIIISRHRFGWHLIICSVLANSCPAPTEVTLHSGHRCGRQCVCMVPFEFHSSTEEEREHIHDTWCDIVPHMSTARNYNHE